MPLPTLDDFKTHLNMTGSGDDDELYDVLDAAVDVVEGIVGPLRGQSVTETHFAAAGSALLLRHRPVAAVVSVASLNWGSPSTSWGVDEYRVDAEAGLLYPAPGTRFAGDITVTYTAGYGTIPAAVRLATLIVAAHLWETQRGTSPSALALQQADIDPSVPIASGFAIPNRARELLAAYAKSGQVA